MKSHKAIKNNFILWNVNHCIHKKSTQRNAAVLALI